MKKARVTILQTIIVGAISCVQAQQSSLVHPGNDGKLVYVPHANTQESNAVNIIPDFSTCGYGGGGVVLPIGTVPVQVTLSPQDGNDRKRIQDAINQVSELAPDANGFRGAVLLKAGAYEVNDGNIPTEGNALLISRSGVVLRGEGQGPNGTILISDAEKQHTLLCIQPPVSPSRIRSNITRITDTYVRTGAKSFSVQSTSGFSVGDAIYVTFTPNQTWLDSIFANNYMESGDLLWDTQTYTVNFERKITALNGNTITINSPIVQPMQTQYGGGEISLFRVSAGERLYNVGVEDIRLQGAGITGTSSATSQNRLQFAIRPRYVENGWVHGVTGVRVSESTVKTWDVRYFTVEECAYIDPLGPKEGGWRYAFGLDAGSNHVLFQRNYSYDGRHDYVSHARMPGPNVFLDCVSELGTTIGPHERWAMGTLFDNLRMESLVAISEHRGTSGTGHAWAGAQQIGWNLESAAMVCDAPKGHMNYSIGCLGTEVLSSLVDNTRPGVYRGYYESKGTHVATRSLYLQQLDDRLGSGAVANVTVPEQRTETIYGQLASWAGNGPFVSTFFHVTGVTVTPSTAIISSALQLTATVSPTNATNKRVTWTSSAPAVATVNSSGLVTPVAAGTATITVAAQDGGKTATSAITVTTVTSFTYIASEDAFVRGGTYGNINYGSSVQLEIKQGTVPEFFRKGLVKFDLSSAQLNSITNAKLRLYANTAAATTITAYESADNWLESTVTWNNAPTNDSTISSVTLSASSVHYEFDVTAYVQAQIAGDGVVSIGMWDLTASNVNVNFNSREANSNKPELVVQTSITAVSVSAPIEIPNEFGILQNYPNPFNPSTTIRYQLPVTSHVTLEVYDMLGRIVASLVHGTREAGYHTAVFDGSNLSSGIFYARMAAQTQAGKGVSRTAKLLLVK